MSRYAVSLLPNFTTVVMPFAKAVKDHDFVPKSSLSIDRHNVGDNQISIRQIIRQVRFDGYLSVRI